MEKLFLFSFMFLLSMGAFSQNTDLTKEPILTDKQRTWLNLQGIGVNNYDWKSPEINKNLNLALSYNKKARMYNSTAWTALSLGLAMVGPAWAWYEDSDSKAGFVMSGLLITGSVPLFVFKGKNNKKSDTYISKVITGLRSN